MQIDRILHGLYRWETVWDAFAAAAMFVIMLTLVGDALGRYVFSAPIPWAHDLASRVLLPAVFFFTLSSALRVNQHVHIDILFERLSTRDRNLAIATGAFLAVCFFGVIAALGARTAVNAFIDGEQMSGAIEWPVWIYTAFLPVGVLPLLVRLLIRMRESALRVASGQRPLELAPRIDDNPEGL